jgi:NAD(P)-dependent dehydrogenase (short-subunit alcohol dehydrogenase family)
MHDMTRTIPRSTSPSSPAADDSWRGKSVLITGASRGLGRALSETLALAGARVVMVARGRERLEAAAERIAARAAPGGGRVHALVADVGDKAQVYPLAGAARALVGELDAVVHAASSLGRTPLRPLLDTDCEDLSRVLEVNLLGPFRLTKALAGSMALRRQGQIVFISSDASVEAYENWGSYAVSKAALDHLARIWALELSPFDVRCFAVDPGEMDTVMHREALPDADPGALQRPEHVAEHIVRMLQSERVPSGARVTVADWRQTA